MSSGEAPRAGSLRAFVLDLPLWAGFFLVVALPLLFDPFALEAFEPVKARCLILTAAAIVVATVLGSFTERRTEKSLRRKSFFLPLTVAALVFACAHLASAVFSPEPGLSFLGGRLRHGTLTELSALACAAIFGSRVQGSEQARPLSMAMVAGSVPVALYGVVQAFGLDPLSWVTDSVSVAGSTLGRSNFLGAYLAMVVPFTLFTWLDSRKKRWRIGLVLALQCLALVLSEARAALLGLGAGAMVFLYVVGLRRARPVLRLAAPVALFAGIGIALMLSRVDIASTGAPLTTEPEFARIRDASVQNRLLIWRETLALLPGRWWVGNGSGRFESVFVSESAAGRAWMDEGMIVDDPHNVVLEHLFTAGVLGLGAWIAVVGSFFVACKRALASAAAPLDAPWIAALLGSVVAYLVEAQFTPDVVVTTFFFWLAVWLAGVAAAGAPRSAE